MARRLAEVMTPRDSKTTSGGAPDGETPGSRVRLFMYNF